MASEAERKRLMKIKKRMAQKRPKFAKFESWRLARLKDHWRRPTGIDNKMRQKRKGWPKTVNVGYGSPKSVRNLHPSGYEEVAVYNIGDLTIVDPETQVARIGASVGKKKRMAIVEEAASLGIRVLNPGVIEPEEEEFEEELELEEEDFEEDLTLDESEDEEQEDEEP
ncbi:MAG: 50S ribosomal protein L32e [Candidatus Bathyarchaeota archaeon]|nr:MAG: 50S ribosomal protein L32e [Candidatus Bathyarchaeota archaeon]